MASKTAAADIRMTPAALAVLMTDPADAPHGLGLGRTWTASDGAKRVRSIARDSIDRFVNRTGRTMHAYTVDEARAIVAESARAIGGGTATSVDGLRDALGGSKAPSKRAPRKVAKAAPEAQDGAQA